MEFLNAILTSRRVYNIDLEEKKNHFQLEHFELAYRTIMEIQYEDISNRGKRFYW